MAVALVIATAVMGTVALAQETTEPAAQPMEGATITDAGWWNQLRPEASLPTGQPPAPPNPGVPAGSLVVGATAGDPNAVVAVGIDPESLDGATVETSELLVREVSDEGANLNTTFAALVACPITEFWIGGENNVWETQPAYDCSLAEAPGTRAEDGTWTFDIRAASQLWSDGTLEPEGVAIIEDVEPPTAFRTVFGGLGDLAIGIRYVASGGEEPDDPFGGGTSGGGTSGGGGVSTGGGSTSGGSGGGAGGFRPPTGGSAAVPPAPATPVPTTAPATSDEAALPTVPITTGPGSPLGTLQWWTWPLLLVVLAFAVVAMFALGPAGDPVAAVTGRGVTRALEARLATEEP